MSTVSVQYDQIFVGNSIVSLIERYKSLSICFHLVLTHLSPACLLWDIGKQHSPRCDATERGVPSGAILYAWRNFIEK